MKTVIVASHIFSNVDPKLGNTTTGLAIILNDIISRFSDEIEVLYYTTTERIPRIVRDGFSTVESRPLHIGHMLRLRDIGKSIRVYLKTKSIKDAFKSLYTSASFAKFCKVIKEYKPDIMHIHDLSSQNLSVIDFCIKKRIPCLLTLHIYIGKEGEEVVNAEYKELIALERNVLSNYNIPINVISSGMKKRIERDYPGRVVNVILNGTELIPFKGEPRVNLGKKVLLCIGTIMPRKNQTQLLDVLKLIKDEKFNSLPCVYFIGNDPSNGNFELEIERRELADCAIFVGKVNPLNMTEYYKQADAVISVSLNEAFGLTIIEAFKHGKPVLYFNDIDAADDLYAEEAVCLINSHSDESIALAIKKCLSKEWDAEAIASHSRRFDICNTAAEYEKTYHMILEKLGD